MLNLTDQEAPHPKFSSENDFFLYLKKKLLLCAQCQGHPGTRASVELGVWGVWMNTQSHAVREEGVLGGALEGVFSLRKWLQKCK